MSGDIFASLAEKAAGLGCEAATEVSLSPLTSFHIGGAARLMVTVKDGSVIPALLRLCREAGVPRFVLGNGTNLLVPDEGFEGVILRLVPMAPVFSGNTAVCAAGTPLKQLCRDAREHSLSGLEFAYGIPGTVGGALYMNAGAYGGEMADVVTEAVVADEEGIRTVAAADMALGYRHSVFAERECVILSVTVALTPAPKEAIAARMEELIARRREKQPLEYPSAGSYFKRPEGYFAGALIDQCGLKGRRVGDAQISEKHAGFLVNRGHATCAEVQALEEEVRAEVLRVTGVTLEREVLLLR